MTKSNAGSLRLAAANTFSGGLILNAGDLTAANNNAFGTGTLTINGGRLLASGNKVLPNSVVIGGDFTYGGADITLSGPVNLTGSRTISLGTGGIPTLSFSGPIGETSGSFGITFGAGGTFELTGSSTYTGTNVITSTAAVRVGNANALGSGPIRIAGTGAELTGISSGSSVTLSNPILLNGYVNVAASGLQAINLAGPLTLLGDSVIDKKHGNATISGNISGNFNLAFTNSIGTFGSTVLTLSGSNTFTGATTFSRAGTYRLVGGNVIPDLSAVTLVNSDGANPLTLDLNNTIERIGSLASSGTVGGNITLGSGTLIAGGNGLSTTYASVISGSTGNLIKEGAGTFTLNGSNTYTGSTTVNGGTLALDSTSGALAGSSRVTINYGATFSIDNTTANANRFKDTGDIVLAAGNLGLIGNASADTTETVRTNTISTGSSTITVSAGSGRAARLASTASGRLNNGTALFRGTGLGTAAPATPNVANITFSTAPALKGAGGGAGTTTISILPTVIGDASPTGNGSDLVTYDATKGIRLLDTAAGEYKTSITDGQTQLDNVKLTATVGLSAPNTTINSLLLGLGGGVNASGGNPALTLNSGAILSVGGTNNGINIPSLAFGTNEAILTTLNDLQVRSSIGGSGGLTKAGAGILTLSGANSYSGTTTVNDGTLLFNGTLSTDPSSLVVRADATLGGTGIVNRAVTVDDAGILSPGNSPGTLTLGPLALTNGVVLNFELGPHNPDGSAIVGGGTNDLIVVNGDLTLDGLLNVTALTGFFDFGPNANVYRLFNYTGNLVDQTLTIASMPAGTIGSIDTSVAGQVNLVVIPEPAAITLLAVMGFLLRRLRTR